ncbi:MAG: 30S ribosome-binding factor RbfA [bacterium]|nr:30S ribosome-binding factor RbfA [bacterium]
MNTNIKLERMEHDFVREISEIIRDEIKDNKINQVTINSVDITNDLSYAKVYFTTLNDDKKEEILSALNKASNFIRKMLFDKVEIRKMPTLIFVYDTSIEYGKKVEEIIERIKEE